VCGMWKPLSSFPSQKSRISGRKLLLFLWLGFVLYVLATNICLGPLVMTLLVIRLLKCDSAAPHIPCTVFDNSEEQQRFICASNT